jgi:hypothetical protein
MRLQLLISPDLRSLTSASPFCVYFSFLVPEYYILYDRQFW